MKYSMQPVSYFEPLERFLKSYDLDFLTFNNLTKSLNNLTKFQSEPLATLMEYNPNPRILMCQYAGGNTIEIPEPRACDLFHPSITNNGIGYTYIIEIG